MSMIWIVREVTKTSRIEIECAMETLQGSNYFLGELCFSARKGERMGSDLKIELLTLLSRHPFCSTAIAKNS